MKELSIEEKAKAYDKAIKVINDNLGALNEIVETGAEVVNIQSIQNCFYKAFPELKESEDEKIRKVLIGWINLEPSTSFNDTFDGFSKEQILAWLEKQGEKPQGKTTLEDVNEEKFDNANKVEPKFNLYDWVVTDKGDTVQIVAVNNGYYTLHNGMDFNMSYVDKCWRKWTIQDAKEGDVLVDSLGNVCIYQEPSTGLMYHSHCYGNHKFFIPMGGSHVIVGSYPATKEHRDQLEKAMADAGYVFDFEKKELKEIENEEYDGEDYGIDGLWHAKNILEKTLGNVDGYQSDDGILEHKCAISAVDKLYKHSIAWSEEDKHWMQKAIDFMNHPDLIKATPTLAKDTINWLKSLKGRVQPQSKQEWSEEDESNFQGIIDELKVNKHHAPDCDLPTYDRFLSWFKSLKERYVWKPSDEQMKILSTYANVNDVLASLYQDLKKLKE